MSETGVALAELDGLRMLDVPWMVQPDHSAVMVYPKRSGATRSLDLDRLYGLGIDAYRLARELALRPGFDVSLDGVTGRLLLRFDNGAARFERSEPAVVYSGGAFKPAGP
ncbi:MAG: penicillin-binding protein activator [Massilia sp.]|nr:penicillin-binding protein activator [Massilia sp.]